MQLRKISDHMSQIIWVKNVATETGVYNAETRTTYYTRTEITLGKDASWYYGDWTNCDKAEATHAVMFGCSDYYGSSYDKSNIICLIRDFPRSTALVNGGHGTMAVMVKANTRSLPLLEAIGGIINEYPVYDEMHHSEMEMLATDDAWEQFLEADTKRDLENYFQNNYSTNYLDSIMDMIPLHDWYYDSIGEMSDYPYFESTDSIVFPCHNDSVEYLAGKIIEWIREDYKIDGMDVLPLKSTELVEIIIDITPEMCISPSNN
jgi:hypothetical protein